MHMPTIKEDCNLFLQFLQQLTPGAEPSVLQLRTFLEKTGTYIEMYF